MLITAAIANEERINGGYSDVGERMFVYASVRFPNTETVGKDNRVQPIRQWRLLPELHVIEPRVRHQSGSHTGIAEAIESLQDRGLHVHECMFHASATIVQSNGDVFFRYIWVDATCDTPEDIVRF